MTKEKKFAIVLPAANEAETIEKLSTELLREITKLKISGTLIYVVDTVSTDDTMAILKKIARRYKEVVVIYEPKNRNVVDAYIRGFREALERKYDYIIDMDCGFSHLPSELYKIVNPLRDGYDCVFGMRPLYKISYPVPIRRRIYSLGGTILSDVLLGMRYRDTTSGYNGYTYQALKKILRKPILSTGNFWHTEMRYRTKDMKYTEVQITYSFPSELVRQKVIQDAFTNLWYLTKQRFLRS